MAEGPARIDWIPGPAARQAIDVAGAMLTGHNRQDVIDRLVILGLWVLKHNAPPQLHGNDRHRWRLPPDLRLPAE